MTTSGLDVVGRTREVPLSWRLGVTGACYLGYLGLLAPLWAVAGPGTAVLAVLPVVVAGITLGAVPGAVAALLAYFGGTATLVVAGHGGAAILVTPEGLPMLIGLVAAGSPLAAYATSARLSVSGSRLAKSEAQVAMADFNATQ